MNKNNRKRQRSENLLKLRFPSGGSPETRKTSQIRITKELEKIARNRSCYVRPKQFDFGQITDKPCNEHSDAFNSVPSIERYIPKESEQNSIDAVISDKNIQLEELERVLRTDEPDIQTCSQYGRYGQNYNNSAWENIYSVHNIEDFLHKSKIEDPIKNSAESLPQNVHISETPKIKTIAEKFSKFKRNNMELRRLDEQVVCLEYDIYNQDSVDESAKPMQRMRVFFSIKPDYNNSEELLKELLLHVKQEFKVLDEDLLSLTEKEIEIIDDSIDANKAYLEDLRRILKQKQLIDIKKNKSSLDLKSLYEMAKRANSYLNSDLSAVNFLSKAELQEIKGLILSQCKSSVHGISRRKINSKDESKLDMGCLSGSIIAELLRENGKIDVFK